MKDYRFEGYQSGVLLMAEFNDEDNHFRYLVYYPNVNTTENIYSTEWKFRREDINSHSSCEWELDDEEKEEIKNYIRKVLSPRDLNEYQLIKFFDYSYRVKHPDLDANKTYIVYYPHFDYMEPVDKKIFRDWIFEIVVVPEDENEENNYLEWNLTENEQEFLKDLVRKEKPSDIVQFEFLDWGANNYLVYSEKKDNKGIRYITAYPTKENLSKWLFYCEVDKEEGDYELEDWQLEKDNQEAIKYFVRNVLKPTDLCEEGKETDMKEGYENLNVAVPKEYATEVMNIISRYDGFKTPPQENDCVNCEFKNQLEQYKKDNEENNKLRQHAFDSAGTLIKSILESIHGEIDYETFENICSNFTDEQIADFGLEEYKVKPKLKKTKYKVTKEVTSYIEVITREGENPLDCISYHEDDSEFNSLFESGEDETSYSYSEEDEDNLTYEQAANFLDDVIIDSDLDREIRY